MTELERTYSDLTVNASTRGGSDIDFVFPVARLATFRDIIETKLSLQAEENNFKSHLENSIFSTQFAFNSEIITIFTWLATSHVCSIFHIPLCIALSMSERNLRRKKSVNLRDIIASFEAIYEPKMTIYIERYDSDESQNSSS